MPRKAFLTGGTGFIGLNIAELLVREGWHVVAMHRQSSDTSGLRRLDVELKPGDLANRDSILSAMPEGVDAVFHAGARVSYWRGAALEMEQVNVLGTRYMVEAALTRGAGRFIHTSSRAAFDKRANTSTEVISESNHTTAIHSPIPYPRSKARAELEVRNGIERGLDAVILNPSNVIGRLDSRNWGRAFLMVHQGALPGIPPGSDTFSHGGEVARAHLSAYERGRTGENYLLSCTQASLMEVFTMIGQMLERPVPKRPLPGWLIRIVGLLHDARGALTGKEPAVTHDLARQLSGHHACTSAKAQDELGYKPQSLEDMLRDCHDWLKSSGRLQ